MPEIEDEPAAMRDYRRALIHAAEDQVTDAAEEIIMRAWVAELDRLRRAALRLAMTARIRDRVAREQLRAAQVAGRPAELARAHARYVDTVARTQEGLGYADSLLADVQAELEAVARREIERTRRGLEGLQRLHTAWAAANGEQW